MLRKIIITVLVILFSWGGLPVISHAAEAIQPTIFLNETKLAAAAILQDGELLLPLRAVSEGAGYTVTWSTAEQTVSFSKNSQSFVLKPGEQRLEVAGHESYLPCTTIINNQTYVPANFFYENLSLLVQYKQAEKEVRLTSIQENPIQIKTVKEYNQNDRMEISIQYPEIQGLANQDVQQKINTVLARQSDLLKGEVLQNIAELETPEVRHIQTQGFLNYRVTYNQQDLISVVIDKYLFTGGAHGITIRSALTFNLATGESYGLKDIFTANPHYLADLNAGIKEQIVEKELNAVMLAPFAGITAEQGYYLSNDQVVIFFQQYEYTPYAYGFLEFALPR